MCPWLLRPVRLLDIIVIFTFQERKERKRLGVKLSLPRQFEVSGSSASSRKRNVVDDPSFASALASERPQGKTRKSGRDRKAVPVFQRGMP